MNSSATLHDLHKTLTPGYLRTSQSIHAAIGVGPLVFLIVMLLILNEPTGKSNDDVELVQMLSIFHLAFGLTVYGLAKFVFENQFRALRDDRDAMLSPAVDFLAALRKASTIRLAMFEGVAFFGLAVCFSAAQAGVLQEHPVYWLNGFSTGVLVAFIAATFPNVERISDLFREKVLSIGAS